MAQFWYLGARVKESSANAVGKIRQHDVARWVNTAFESADAAAAAAAPRMVKHPGTAYFIQGFDRKLVIDADGYSKGFEEVKEGIK